MVFFYRACAAIIALFFTSVSTNAIKTITQCNGCYLGLSVGYMSADARSEETYNMGIDIGDYDGAGPSEFKPKHISMNLGKDWAFNRHILGVELTFGKMDLKGQKQHPARVGLFDDDSIASVIPGTYAEIAARFGLSLKKDFLAFIKAGFFDSNIKQSYIDDNTAGAILVGQTSTLGLDGKSFGFGLEIEKRISDRFNLRFSMNRHNFNNSSNVATAFVPNEDTYYSGIEFNHTLKSISYDIGLTYRRDSKVDNQDVSVSYYPVRNPAKVVV